MMKIHVVESLCFLTALLFASVALAQSASSLPQQTEAASPQSANVDAECDGGNTAWLNQFNFPYTALMKDTHCHASLLGEPVFTFTHNSEKLVIIVSPVAGRIMPRNAEAASNSQTGISYQFINRSDGKFDFLVKNKKLPDERFAGYCACSKTEMQRILNLTLGKANGTKIWDDEK